MSIHTMYAYILYKYNHSYLCGVWWLPRQSALIEIFGWIFFFVMYEPAPYSWFVRYIYLVAIFLYRLQRKPFLVLSFETMSACVFEKLN